MKRVLLGMSGGVDSAAAAAFLRRQGYEVEGATLLLEGNADGAGDAARAAAVLGIPHRTVELRETFRREVMDVFAAEYRAGRTPNPCVLCNRAVKFGAMLRYALDNGFDAVATGHYARIREENGRFLLEAVPSKKDQSYMLYALSQEQLAHIVFPIGSLEKEQVREVAREAGLPVASKPDSQDICFVPDGDYAAFLARYANEPFTPGDFVDAAGNVLGRHQGLARYTVGQRKGLGSFGKPMYVTALDAARNRVVLGEEGSQYRAELTVSGVNWIPFDAPAGPIRCRAKIRYHAPAAPCEVTPLPGGRAAVRFDEPQRSVTPGQSAVFYDGALVLGGGLIDSDTKEDTP